MASDLMALRQNKSLAWNSLKQLEINFVWYAKYDGILLQDLIEDKKWPTEYGNAIEKFLTCQVFICYRLLKLHQMS